MLNRLLLAAACVGALGLAGCSSSTTRSSSSGGDTSALEARLNKAIEDAERAAEEARRAARSGGGGSSYSYSPDVGNGMEVHSMAFPTGDPATSPIQVDQVTPSQANRGAPYEVHYHVTNVSSSTLQNVSVIAGEFQNYDIDGFAPAPQETADGYMWYIGDLASQETKVLRVRGTSHELRNMSSCVSVAYANSLCASTPIVEAGLELVKSAPDMSILCDSITLSYRVCNPGTGTARNVVVRDELPAGMALVSGGRVVNREVGDLGPGDCFDFAVDVKVENTGEYCSTATARAEGGLEATSEEPCTVFRQPVLAVTAECAELRYLGRNVEFEYTVSNTGDAVSANTVAVAKVPADAQIVRMTEGGSVRNGQVTWNLGDMAPGATRNLTVVVAGSKPVRYETSIMADGDCAEQVSESCGTLVQGIPAILLEVIDTDDPVEVGNTTTYVITVTNQGTARDTNIAVECVLPDELEYVSGTGSTAVRANGQNITLGTVADLPPKERVTWTLTVRAREPGNVRFRVELNSDELGRPVNETEATNLYR